MVGGVAGGIAARMGLDATVVRVVFVLLTIGGGTGLALYVLLWLFIPRPHDDSAIIQRAFADRRTVTLVLALGVALLALCLTVDAFGTSIISRFVWPASLGVGGLLVVWRGAEDDERAYIRDLVLRTPPGDAPRSRRRRRTTVARVVVGAAMVVAGLGALVASRHPTGAVLDALAGATVVIAGFLVVFGPWWSRVVKELAEEHRERVRVQERADVASAVHDSVLQTLALIQRAAGDRREVTRLARAQERDLRAWLFEGRPPGSFDGDITTVVAAIAVIERDVEAAHGVTVESVVVGDCPLTSDLEALCTAGREAAVNAAKWSGESSVSLFVEVESERVTLFVRDRGMGFDPAAVAPDRRGISQSIRARLQRHGGSATIRSEPQQGTEIELVMPRRGQTARAPQ